MTVEQTSRALSSITISGQITDASGLGLVNVTVALNGSSQSSKKTDAQGNYAFTGLNPGSYSLQPALGGCSFLPDVVNLNNLTASTVQGFAGSGATCGGTVNVNVGAMNGPFTISGQLTDASGKRIVGGRINLGGTTSAIRFSDYTGRYTFHVAAGSYNLTASASGTCTLAPANAALNGLNGNRTQDFMAAGADCVAAAPLNTSPTGQYLSVTQGATSLGVTLVRVEPRASVADAQAALQQIAQEQSAPVTNLTIAGFPALERQVTVPTPEIELPSGGEAPDTLGITTAVAAGSTLVRFESRLALDASAATINAFVFGGRNFGLDSIGRLFGPAPTPIPTTRPTAPNAGTPQLLTAPSEIGLFNGELQVAASGTSDSAVVAAQTRVFYTNDFGKTTPVSTLNTVPPTGATSFSGLGDPSIAVGPFNGTTSAYYTSRLARVVAGSATAPPTVAIALLKSTDEGVSFSPTTTAYPLNCFTSNTCVVPDQAQLAVDKKNRANGTNDQIYLAWRNFQPKTLAEGVSVACSADSGATWKIDNVTLGTKNEDVPRLTVADDGSVFVVYRVSQGNQVSLQMQKFSSCAAGFTPPTAPTPFPTQVALVTDGGAVAGMPRPPGISYNVSGSDDTSKVVYVAYTTQSTAGNDDVHVAQWSDSSQSWVKNDVVNSSGTGRRYFPAICTSGSSAFVAWYDRRAGGDKTSYFRRTLINDGATLAHEFNVSGSGAEDPECLAGFPGGGASSADAELLCTDLPTNNSLSTGTCQLATCPSGVPACGMQAACDFRTGSVGGSCTTTGESCMVPFNGGVAPGSPTFGDYNGTACAKGRMFLAWATTTAPADSCTMTGDACSDSSRCCSTICESGICKSVSGACAANGGACTVDTDCCNGLQGPGVCQGGICFRRVGVFMATGGQAVSVHITGTGTVTLTDTMGQVTTFNAQWDHTLFVGLDGSSNSFADTVSSSPIFASAGSGFRIQPNDSDILITGEGFSFGTITQAFANNPPTIIVNPGQPATFSNGVTTGTIGIGGTLYRSASFSFSLTYTTTLEP
ncbi:MAG TPA: carboxypeptidase-like regulatory domain-containing protein [Polyangia bacterium]|nr:carboxypeptidase-like regulatory domain-containing protein [Polyangia bacterium]